MTDISTSLTPEDQTEEDRLANDVLYQEFLKREEGNTPTTTDQTTEEESSGSGGAGGAAPTSVPPGQTTDDTTDTTDTDTTDSTTDDTTDTDTTDTDEDEDDESVGFSYNDRNFTPDEANKVLALYDWATNLPEGAGDIIDAALSGEYVLVPKASVPTGANARNPAWQPIGADPTTVPTTPTTATDDDDLLNDVDPAVKARLDALQSQVGELTEAQQAVLRQTQEQQRQQLVAAVETGTEQFRAQYDLSPEQAADLRNRVVNMQILPSFAAQHRGDIPTAMKSALDAVYWSDPTYRQRETTRQLEKERQNTKRQDQKKTKASSLTSGGGSVPRGDTPADTPKDRKQQMVAELEKAMADR